MLDNIATNVPATRQEFRIKTFKERDDWIRAVIASDLSRAAKVTAIRLAL